LAAPRILGLGPQENLIDVVRLADAELEKSHGPSRSLVAVAPGIEVRATREAYSGPFQSYVVRIHVPPESVPAFRANPRQSPSPCTVEAVDEANGVYDLQCPAPASDSSNEPLALLGELVRLPEVWHVHGEDYRHDRVSIGRLFQEMAHRRASDVHLYPGSSPVFRVDGVTLVASELEPVSGEQILALLREIAPVSDWEKFEKQNQCSFNYHQFHTAFSRVSAFVTAGVPHLTLRFLPEQIPSFEDLHIPRTIMERLGALHHGLVLIAGMTGSGKSTTVASLIDWINANKSLHILTIEDPVEFVHANKKSIVSQRNVGSDVATFQEGVRGALRHDPDVIFIGEMRDPDTIRAAIDAASTGHLVLTTFHSNTAAESVNRIVSFFDPVERDLVRLQLRDSLKCVICQRLLPRKGGGRIPALEFLFNDSRTLAESIQKGDSAGIRTGMQQTISESKIFERSLYELSKTGLITLETALAHATTPEIVEQMRLGTYVPPHLERISEHRVE
jgi:twitching motility protein PilT